MTATHAFLFLATMLVGVPLAPESADRDPDLQEEAAIRAAVELASPAVVRIETLGAAERAGQPAAAAATTGLIVDPAGYVVSSAFGFAGRPASILVRLPDGRRLPAKPIAADHSRWIVLLKIDADRPLLTLETVPLDQMRVGQWTIALGRTFDSDRPNMAVGILSALNRIWGKAVQTDAAVSPNNYGGPLVDIRGRALGVLVPLAPDADEAMAGLAWYDSGVGFAVPMEHIERILPRMKRGEDLYPGRAGLRLKAAGLYADPPVIAECREPGPAAAAGLKPGDRIVAVDGRPIVRAAELMEELGRRYAGDKMRMTVVRNSKRIDFEITLGRPALKTSAANP